MFYCTKIKMRTTRNIFLAELTHFLIHFLATESESSQNALRIHVKETELAK